MKDFYHIHKALNLWENMLTNDNPRNPEGLLYLHDFLPAVNLALFANDHWPQSTDGQPHIPNPSPLTFADPIPESPQTAHTITLTDETHDYTIHYTYDPQTSLYTRHVNGARQLDADGTPLTFANILIQAVPLAPDGKATLLISSPIHAFVQGGHTPGLWSPPDAHGVWSYTDEAGAPLPLAPGHTFIHLVSPGTPVTITDADGQALAVSP